MHRWTIGAALVIGTWSTWVSGAHASTDAGVCTAPTISPVPGALPVNVPGFVISARGGATSAVELVRIEEDGTETPLDIVVEWLANVTPAMRIVPSAPFEVGVRYVVRVQGCVPGSGLGEISFEYVAVDAVPVPATLGTVQISPLRRIESDVGEPFFFVDTTLVPDTDFAPWLGLYAIDFVAESELGTTPSTPRLATATRGLLERFAIACEGADPTFARVAPGAMTVRVRATSFFDETDVVEASASTTTACDESIDVTPPGVVLHDAAVGLGLDAGVAAAEGGAAGSCACRATSGSRPGTSFAATWLVLGIAIVLRRERAYSRA
ncbi:hypothetical protein [Sandaracinus amylolyticus]|uniref:Uncharacterized protein n=1 Tax=Sandaracinus amylolyticus TaxID=927083 RepID=A0A0F6SHS8_9BACT|nr:hypothetical protein [Sandaracinus amylolyticus]AKF10969.1 hypothetical protein DB32_008118 [Sandaracinus amylolyticus]